MRGLARLPRKYFNKFSDKPVKIKPFDPNSQKIAREYIQVLRKLLGDLDLEFIHRGSTAFGIAGKGDIEIGVYPRQSDWDRVLKKLTQKYGEAGNVENNYARFNDLYNGQEIEVIVMKGHEAEVDRELTNFLIIRPDLLKEYEKLKFKYAFSKKEYMIQKDKFLNRVVGMIPG